jgi:hypothetical protein
VALAALLVGSTAPTGGAETPCWKQLINDWYDGRIDDTYPIPCYREAIKHLPTDAQTYSSAAEDIGEALALVIAGKDPNSGSGGATPGGSSGSGGSGGSSSPGTGSGTGGSGTGKPGTGSSGSGGSGGSGSGGAGTGGPVGGALDDLGPSDADSVPIPVIVLGSIAVLLVGLGAAGLIVRRVHTKRAQLRAVSAAPPAQET